MEFVVFQGSLLEQSNWRGTIRYVTTSATAGSVSHKIFTFVYLLLFSNVSSRIKSADGLSLSVTNNWRQFSEANISAGVAQLTYVNISNCVSNCLAAELG